MAATALFFVNLGWGIEMDGQVFYATLYVFSLFLAHVKVSVTFWTVL
jgi:hypothetical protein